MCIRKQPSYCGAATFAHTPAIWPSGGVRCERNEKMAANGPPPGRKPLSAHASCRTGRGSDYRGTSCRSSALSHTRVCRAGVCSCRPTRPYVPRSSANTLNLEELSNMQTATKRRTPRIQRLTYMRISDIAHMWVESEDNESKTWR
jgi:hypothetical protein